MPNNLKEIRKAIGPTIIVLLSWLLLSSTIIALVNLINPLSILWGLRMVLRYLLLFAFAYKYFNANDVLKCKRILLNFFWINAAVVILQYFIEGKSGDFIGGTFANNGELFVFNLLCTFIFSKDYFENKLKRNKYLLFIAIEMLIAMTAEIKMMYFTIPLAIYSIYVFTKKFSFKHILILAIAFFCLIPTLKMTMLLMYDKEYVNNVFDIEYITEETSHSYNLSEEAADFSFNRTTCVEMATTLILQDNIHILTGYGIGSGNTSERFGSWISQQYSAITSYNWFTSSWLLIEYGWIGYIIWIIIMVCLAWRFYRFYKKTTDSVVKYWSSLGFLSALFVFIIAWYNNIPYYNAYFIYLFWAICFVAIRERIKLLHIRNSISQSND